MNEKGYSWLEAILALTVIVIVFGTLLPLATNMTTMLFNKKIMMNAAETIYHGAILYKSYGINEGVHHIDGYAYEWVVKAQSICVSYKLDGEVQTKCVG